MIIYRFCEIITSKISVNVVHGIRAPLTIDISDSSNVVVAMDCKQTLMKYSFYITINIKLISNCISNQYHIYINISI